jgi:glycosyl transferase family 25
MRAFVITINSNVQSRLSAERCIASGKKYGLNIETMAAITPKDDVDKLCVNVGIVNTEKFDDKYSKRDNCIACFLSHYTLWKTCISLNEPIVIFEHDAIVTGTLTVNATKLCR